MTDVTEIKELITKQGEAWGEFQRTNDEILAKKANGESVQDLQAKLNLISTDMADIRKSMQAVEAKSGRDAMAGAGQVSEDTAAHRKAYAQYVRTGDSSGLAGISQKAVQTGIDPNAGYLVSDEVDSVIDRVVPTISAMIRLADVKTIGGPTYRKAVKTAGMSMTRRGDGQNPGETTAPQYAEIRLEAFSADVEPWVYNETLEDARINIENDLAMEAAISFAEGIGAELITGNGVGKARGITAYTNVANSSYAWGSVGYIASGKSAAFASVAPADKIVSLQHALKAQYRPGAVFLTNDSTLALIRQIKDASGAYYLWQPDPTAAFGGRLLGHPVEVDDNFAAVAAGTYSLAFGNFKRGYTVVQRKGVTLIRDNLTAKGTTKFNFSMRVGGGITNYEAIKLMKFATS